MGPDFQLLDEPWILVRERGCATKPVSLTDALVNAHHYAGLAGESPAQDAALLRLLIAIAHTVFYRVDEDGTPTALEDEDEALDRWAALWERRAFPEGPIRAYLEHWRDRFNLFDPVRPFYQVPEAKIGTLNTAEKLNGMILKSGNKPRIFSGLTAETGAYLSFAEAARWLLYLNAYDDSSMKPKTKAGKGVSTGIGWLGKFGLIYAQGDSLFETILLNLSFLKDGKELYGAPRPCWELDRPRSGERIAIPEPDNLPELFTLQSRRVLLHRDGERVVGFAELGGDFFEPQNAFSEPMTVWKPLKKKDTVIGYVPRQHSAGRQLWRDFAAVAVRTGDNRIPGISNWITALQLKDCLEADRLVRFSTVAVLYDSKNCSVVDSVSDTLSFHAQLLTEAGQVWREKIQEQIELTDKAARCVARLAGELALAAGKTEKENSRTVPTVRMTAAQAAEAQYYFRVDRAFRVWLLQPNAGQDGKTRDALCLEWRRTAVQLARHLGEELVSEAGPAAQPGRWIKDDTGTRQTHISAAEAFNRFLYWLNKLEKEGV